MGCFISVEIGLNKDGVLWSCLGAGTGPTGMLDFEIGFELLLASSEELLLMVLVVVD